MRGPPVLLVHFLEASCPACGLQENSSLVPRSFPTHTQQQSAIEKVLEAKANKRGKLVEALVAWSPTWESARNLNEVTTAEAYALLGFK